MRNGKKDNDLQKEVEMYYAQFFVDWYNNKYDTRYTVRINDLENSSIDAFGESSSSEPIYMQMVTSNSETIRNGIQNAHNTKNQKEFILNKVKGTEWILDAVKKKTNKKYTDADKLTLIIQGCTPTPNPNDVQGIVLPDETLFNGVYFVSLPKRSSTHKQHEENGYVVELKHLLSKRK